MGKWQKNVLLKIKSLLLLLLIILNKVLSNPIWPQFYFVAQPGLELLVILAVTPRTSRQLITKDSPQSKQRHFGHCWLTQHGLAAYRMQKAHVCIQNWSCRACTAAPASPSRNSSDSLPMWVEIDVGHHSEAFYCCHGFWNPFSYLQPMVKLRSCDLLRKTGGLDSIKTDTSSLKRTVR